MMKHSKDIPKNIEVNIGKAGITIQLERKIIKHWYYFIIHLEVN